MAILEIAAEEQHERLVVRVTGELDVAGATQFRDKVDSLLSDSGATHLCVDLSGVSFLDSSGIGALLGRYRLLTAQNGTMSLVAAQEPIQGLLDLSGVLRVIPLYQTEREAFNRS